MAPNGRWRNTFDVASTGVLVLSAITLVIIATALYARVGSPPTPPEQRVPSEPISISDAAVKGLPTARAVLIAFSEFECPYCARFALETMPLLERDYISTGKVLFAFRHLPLPMHKVAPFAAQAVECAGAQNQFWPMHDLLFQNQATLEREALGKHAEGLKLDTRAFAACMQGKFSEKVRLDTEAAKVLGLRSTPFFLVGVRRPDGTVAAKAVVRGARPFADFQKALDQVLQEGQ